MRAALTHRESSAQAWPSRSRRRVLSARDSAGAGHQSRFVHWDVYAYELRARIELRCISMIGRETGMDVAMPLEWDCSASSAMSVQELARARIPCGQLRIRVST